MTDVLDTTTTGQQPTTDVGHSDDARRDALVERLFGACRWLGIYFACGVIGELAGYAWKPVGAGASVAGAGLLGAIAAWLLLENRSPQARIGGVIVLVSGTILTVFRDLHGPPMIVGALMGWGMLKKAEDGVR